MKLLVLTLLFSSTAFAAPEGDWNGTLDAGPVKLRVAFHIKKQKDGTYSSTFDSLDQGARGIVVDTTTYVAPTVKMAIAKIGGGFEGKLDGDALDGTWSQGGRAFPLSLHRGAAAELRRPQVPKRPFPYREVEVEIPVESFKLAGTLTVPEGKGPFPAVVFVTGSGPQDRDETIFDHKPFLVISDALTRRGIATLRLDDRGVGRSGGSAATATSLDFASDIETAATWLAARPEVDKRAIGLLGHSEGGLIAPIVASRSTIPRFLVLLAGTGETGLEVLRQQVPASMRVQGMSEHDVDAAMKTSERVWAIIMKEADPKAADVEIRKALANDPVAMKNLPQGAISNPWMHTFLTLDPVPYLKKVRVPVLAMNGDRDLQVDASNLELIGRALAAGGDRDVTILHEPELNHLFQHCTTGAVSEYATIEETFSPAALKQLTDWVIERAARAKK